MRARSAAASARFVAPTTAPRLLNPAAPTVAAPAAATRSPTASATVRPSASRSDCSASPDGFDVRTSAKAPRSPETNGRMPSVPRYALTVVQPAGNGPCADAA